MPHLMSGTCTCHHLFTHDTGADKNSVFIVITILCYNKTVGILHVSRQPRATRRDAQTYWKMLELKDNLALVPMIGVILAAR
jgi:hypothetical protein